jgi:DNA (cytosine-5)-methyltransferase 1
MRGKWAELLPSIPEGQNYLWHTERGGGEPLFGWRRRYWSFLLKLAKGQPAWTIQAQPGPAIGPFHWKNRRLSARELCRLQTIPDSYQVSGNLQSVQRQVGNAVPSALAESLAREIRAQLLGDRISIDATLVPNRRLDQPPAEAVEAVPTRFLSLSGKHAAHPGTGQGYAAKKRSRPLDSFPRTQDALTPEVNDRR